MSKSQNKELIANLVVANTFKSRLVGLLDRQSLSNNEALWIHRCNSIHTFGMKFPIDVVFVNRDLVVRGLKENVRPQRLPFPVWGASSAIEMAAGQIANLGIKVGDQLYVGH